MLLPRKSEDGWSKWEAEVKAKVWRSIVREQCNSTSLQIATDEGIRILPYAYFQEARFYRHEQTWEISLYWPSVTVTVKGLNLEKMVRLVAEHGLAGLEFHPNGEKHAREDLPEFESVTMTPRPEDRLSLPAAAAKPSRGPTTTERQCYSVV